MAETVKFFKIADEKITPIYGELSKDNTKCLDKIKNFIDAGEVTMTVTDENDQEMTKSIALDDSIVALILVKGTKEIILMQKNAASEDEQFTEPLLVTLASSKNLDPKKYQGWIFGKIEHQLLDTEIIPDYFIAFRTREYLELPISTDNYVDFQMSWIMDVVYEDFYALFPDYQETEDDREDNEDGEFSDGDDWLTFEIKIGNL